jgi:hypothetical protein
MKDRPFFPANCQLHVVRAEEGGPGDCAHCPASALDCPADTDQTMTEVTTRAV